MSCFVNNASRSRFILFLLCLKESFFPGSIMSSSEGTRENGKSLVLDGLGHKLKRELYRKCPSLDRSSPQRNMLQAEFQWLSWHITLRLHILSFLWLSSLLGQAALFTPGFMWLSRIHQKVIILLKKPNWSPFSLFPSKQGFSDEKNRTHLVYPLSNPNLSGSQTNGQGISI